MSVGVLTGVALVLAGVCVLSMFAAVLAAAADYLARLGEDTRTQAEVDALEEWIRK